MGQISKPITIEQRYPELHEQLMEARRTWMKQGSGTMPRAYEESGLNPLLDCLNELNSLERNLPLIEVEVIEEIKR